MGAQARAVADNELAASASTFYVVAPGIDGSIAPMVHSLVDRLQALFYDAHGGTVWVLLTVAAAAIKNSDTKALFLGTAIGGVSDASTIPPVNDALTTHNAAARIANDLVAKLNEACSKADPAIHAMCAHLGLPRMALPNPPD